MKFRECKVDISFSFVVAESDQSHAQLLTNLSCTIAPWLQDVLPHRTISPARIESRLGDSLVVDMGES